MRLSYDLHLHSCLSPCGSDDASPGSVAGMLSLAGVEICALTDHNTVKNCVPFIKHAENYGLTALAGMELSTMEEVHVICLFDRAETAMSFSEYVYKSLPDLPNSPDIFGNQIICGEKDEIIGYEEKLLISASGIGIYDVFGIVSELGGIAYPAHIDRSSFSLLSNLGIWDDGMGFNLFEKTSKADPSLLPRKPWVVGSDSHRLEDIPDAAFYLEIEEKTPKAVIDALKAL